MTSVKGLEHKKNYRLLKLILVVWAVYIVLSAVTQILINIPSFVAFWNFQYDWKANDSSFITMARRIAIGKPIYGDWFRGEFLSTNLPLYSYLIAGLDQSLGFNGGHGRQLNLLLSVLTLINIAALTKLILPKQVHTSNRRLLHIASLFVCCMFLFPTDVVSHVEDISPDILALLLSLLTYTFLTYALKMQKIDLKIICFLSLTSVLAGFASSAAIIIPFVVSLMLWKEKRPMALTYLLMFCLLGAAGIFLLNLKNGDTFIENVVFNSFDARTLKGNTFIQTLTSSKVLRFYITCVPIFCLAFIYFKKNWKLHKSDPLCLPWAFHTALLLIIDDSNSHFIIWSQWSLTCIMAAAVTLNLFISLQRESTCSLSSNLLTTSLIILAFAPLSYNCPAFLLTVLLTQDFKVWYF